MLGRTGTKDALMMGGSTLCRRAAVVVAFLLLSVVLLPHAAHAQTGSVDLGLDYATATGLGTTDIRTTISLVIRAFLGLLGLVAVVTILYAGFLWMTAGGNEEKVSSAKKIIVNGVIGLAIVISAYAIVTFLFRALNPEGDGSLFGGGGSALTSLYSSGRGTSALGSGIIESHYPESGQVDVPRNTKVAVTFKKPLVLSTVIRNYADGEFSGEGVLVPTPSIDDDYVCPAGLDSQTHPTGCTKVTDILAPGADPALSSLLELDMMNVKLVPNAGLESPSGGSADEQFDQRYQGGETFLQYIPRASFTPIAATFDPEEGQTLTFKPLENLGSPTEDTNYRVAIRGGDNGVLVWSLDPGTGDVYPDLAFTDLNADGSYFWPFVVGTGVDNTPPQVTAVVPGNTKYLDLEEGIFRNQLLQVYFDEAIDPTSASGTLPGFTKVTVMAKCLTGADCESFYDDWTAVPGEIKIFNRYRTIEFTPSTPCDDVSENSCGEEVYCLPRNTELRVSVYAASVGADAPAASSENGVLDMVGNSFDGNLNGAAEGPSGGTRISSYLVNTYRLVKPTEAVLATMNDTLVAMFHVGSRIDLEPPYVIDISPRSESTTCDPGTEPRNCPAPSTPFDPTPGGPSEFPVTEPIKVVWNKTVSVGSIRTGGYDELANEFLDTSSTVVLRAYECKKTQSSICEKPDTVSCECDPTLVDRPSFMVSAELEDDAVTGDQWSVLSIIHRPFLTGNDLGYTLNELDAFPENMPAYQPVIRAQIRDTRQNCFWPSVGFDCSGLDEEDMTSCCNRLATQGYDCQLDSGR